MDMSKYIGLGLFVIILSGCINQVENQSNSKNYRKESQVEIIIPKEENNKQNENSNFKKIKKQKNEEKKQESEIRGEFIKRQLNNDNKSVVNQKSYEELNNIINKEKQLLERLRERYTEKYPDVIHKRKYIETLIKERAALSETPIFEKQQGNIYKNKNKISLNKEPFYPLILSKHPDNYLPDFSYAGYKWGEDDISDFKGKVFDVTRFGALPNDKKDDTVSVQKALKAANKYKGPVVLYFPEGRFIITEILHIKRDSLVIRGAGGNSRKNTQLFFPNPILKVKNIPEKINKNMDFIIKENKKINGRYYSPASWSGGFIWSGYPGKKTKRLLVRLLSGRQGKHIIGYRLKNKIKVGSTVEIIWCASGCKDANSLLKHTVDNQHVKIGNKTWQLLKKGLIKQTVTIENITGQTITIKEPLLHDINPEWGVVLREYHHIKEVGVESIQMIFPKTKYQGHLQEAGYNAIYFTQTSHSWIHDVYIKNVDSGINITSCKSITVNNVTVSGRKGHYGIVLANSNDILVDNFNIYSRMVHGISMGTAARLNIFSNGKVRNSPIDQHMSLNEQNLFENLKIEINDIESLLKHGGDKDRSPTSGAFTVFWNIGINFKKNSTIKLKNAPSSRLIGIHGIKKIQLDYKPNAYIEALNYSNIKPGSLYRFQLKNRLNRY